MAASGKSVASGEKKLFPERFAVQRTPSQVVQAVRRDPPGFRVHRTGRIEANKSASEIIYNLIRGKFEDSSQCGVVWAYDQQTGEVAGCLAAPDVKGVTPIREHPKRGYFTLYLNGVFKQNPNIRPAGRQWVSVVAQSDPELGDYFVINLNLAVSLAKFVRAKAEAAKVQAEADKQEAKATDEVALLSKVIDKVASTKT